MSLFKRILRWFINCTKKRDVSLEVKEIIEIINEPQETKYLPSTFAHKVSIILDSEFSGEVPEGALPEPLIPCPFCGIVPNFFACGSGDTGRSGRFMLTHTCRSDIFMEMDAKTLEECVRLWNTRFVSDEDKNEMAEIKRLRDGLVKLLDLYRR